MKYFLMFIGAWVGFFFVGSLVFVGLHGEMNTSLITGLFMGKGIVIVFLVSWVLAAILTVVLYTDPLKPGEIEAKKKTEKKNIAKDEDNN